MASFVIGIIVTVAVSAFYVAFVEAYERRQEWNKPLFDASSPSPSERYWVEKLTTQPPQTSETEEYVRLRPASPPDTPR
jgi:hypothetical protein